MGNYINYSGLKHSTTGNTRLTIADNTLDVTGTDHILDGVLIETAIAGEWTAQLKPFNIQAGTIFGATFNQFEKQRRRTISQWLLTQSPDRQFAYLLVNSKLEGQQIPVSGYLNGSAVFALEGVTLTGFADWKIAVVFDIVRHPITITQVGYRSSGHGVSAVTKSIGISGWVLPDSAGTATQITIEKQPPDLIQVDHIRIGSASNSIMSGGISQVVFTGREITPFGILEEHYTTIGN